MIRRLLCSAAIATLPVLSFAQILSVATARAQPAGSVVTLRGIATNGAELGKIRYLQDGTAGIGAYPGTGSAPGFEQAVTAGDSIEVTGTLVSYHGLLEITPISSFQVIASGLPLPAPKPVTLAGLSDALEGQRISIECVTFGAGGGSFSGTGTYDLTDSDGGTARVYVGSNSELLGGDIPGTPIHLTAILSQYDDFQLLPRNTDDFTPATCFYFLEKPRQTELQTNSFTVSWQTNWPTTAKLRYGPSPGLGNEIAVPLSNTFHSVLLDGLQPGTIYWVQAVADYNGQSVQSALVPFATRSLSSGQIRLWFNHPIDEAAAGGLLPEGQSFNECLAAIIARIDSAQQTLDVALYNNNRTDITNALKLAHARGVRVRYIASEDAASQALQPAPPFPVVYGNSTALMHDKFMAIDADLSDKAWVMSGSMNWTTGNMTNDFNNLLFIQDQSLARTYELEFEEMWGSDGALPNLANGRFGGAKKDDTPHQFIIGNSPVESYFSPSDGVTGRIVQAVQAGENEAEFALFSFTKNDLGDALVEIFSGGSGVRGMIENLNDPGCEFDHLVFNGVPVQPHLASGDLHHKYAVLDAHFPDSDPTVVTGSHNWSQNAESFNDENTLVIHNADIARLFAAEFEQRWAESMTPTRAPASGPAFDIFPNPVSNQLIVKAPEGFSGEFRLEIFDVAGRQKMNAVSGAGHVSLDMAQFAPGFYLLKIQTSDGVATRPFQKI